ncbi:Excitatory amino acid transporter-like protein [Emericellopsis cladophorae]|uniref:Amino acid transporter n=1 Tax=Emericellopsis cladophorae TaxID=2686198 RepID=A0A9P9Y6L1_9HYPO|nr:Excitatory amino acid transporter-like protein [Emericellopsis cladophorae]KAI6784528.1 Excitatory amino acid transporter-like protein [Emericellopsis cladophorae]
MNASEKNENIMENQPQGTMMDHDVKGATAEDPSSVDSRGSPVEEYPETVEEKQPMGRRIWKSFKTPGSALQIVSAALLAVAIGLIVSTQVDKVPTPAVEILNIPGDLWLRALKAVVLPLIICAMILAVSRLRDMADGSGGRLAKWTIGYYVLTTFLSIVMSCIMTAFVWGPRFIEVSDDSLDISEADQATADEKAASGDANPPHIVVKTLFRSFITQNVFFSLSNDELLAILIMACVIGYLIKSKDSLIYKLVVELESMIMRIITFLIKVAPIGVFFLVLSNLMKLSIAEIGANLGMLIGGTLGTMAIHLFVILPIIFFAVVRRNPYTYWFRIAPAWITAWGSASSAATLPVTLRCAHAQKIPITVYKFTCPLGCLINMDGTAIYFPMAVVFLAATQGKVLMGVDYVIIVVLATLASIGTTPIPSSSLVLVIMIANSVNVEVTGMYAVIVAIDWLLDRFRTAINVSGDLMGSKVVERLSKVVDPEGLVDETMGPRPDADGARYA